MIFPKKRNLGQEVYSGHLWNKFEEVILIHEAMIAKNKFELLLAVN